MGNDCKGKCSKHKAIKHHNKGHYLLGHKRCQICEIFIKWNGIRCPCCSSILRTKPRKSSDKAKLNEKLKSLIS